MLSLQHPNIVTCEALEHTSTGRYLVMDYCEGGTLRTLMEEDRRLSLPQSLKLVADVLAGLEHAHSRGIVHCDIKPENLLLNVRSNGWTARISDFGIARLAQEIIDEAGGNTGSPAYMAPERFYGKYFPASDLYSIGVLLFELIVGRRPFSGTPSELMLAHLNTPVKLPDSIPEIWRPLILKSLQKLPGRRFHSAQEMLTELKTIAAMEGSGSWLDQQALQLPLFSLRAQPQIPIAPVQQEALTQPITALAAVAPIRKLHYSAGSSSVGEAEPTRLYSVSRNQVSLKQYEQSPLLPAEPGAVAPELQPESQNSWISAPLAEPVKALLPRPQGCFVLTHRSIALISSACAQAAVGAASASANQLVLQPILRQKHDFVAAIEPQGQWLSTLSAIPNTSTGIIHFWQLPGAAHAMALSPQPIQLTLKDQMQPLPQLIAINQRYLGVLTTGVPKSEETSASRGKDSLGTLIRIMSRRGVRLGALRMAVRLKQVILSPRPYRLLAVDAENARSILLIDLKPYRMLRLSVPIDPVFLAAAQWGYVLADTAGNIVLLSEDGEQVGHLVAPSNLTALSLFDRSGLMAATWEGNQGNLYTIDLNQQGIDLLF